MLRISKLFLMLIWLAWAWPSLGEDAVSEPECANGVCVINVIATELISAPCEGNSVLIAYSKPSGATMIQCSNFGSEEENRAFIYNRHSASIKPFEIQGGRFIRQEYLSRGAKEGIPSKFGPIALCAATNPAMLKDGTLVIVTKQPNNSETNPYCYRINYVETTKETLTMRSDDGKNLAPLPDKAAAEWAGIKKTLACYVDDSNTGQPTKTKMGCGSP